MIEPLLSTNCLGNGFVKLIQQTGDDNFIAHCARVSTDANKLAETENKGSRQIIRYMMEHHHTSPFEQVVFWFHCRMPIFVARQIVRHRTARLNEQSGRYSELASDYFVPVALNLQGSITKQGRKEATVDAEVSNDLVGRYNELCSAQFDLYKDLLDAGVAKEIARVGLPVSTYTEWVWQIDLHNLFHFLKLRMDSHAQEETRVYANAMAEMVQQFVPEAWEAFEDFELNAKKFSAQEVDVLQSVCEMLTPEQWGQISDQFAANPKLSSTNNRRFKEFRTKLGV